MNRRPWTVTIVDTAADGPFERTVESRWEDVARVFVTAEYRRGHPRHGKLTVSSLPAPRSS